MAVSPLMKRLRRGWDLLFLSALINLVYAVVTIFIDSRGIGSFFLSLLSSAIGFYLLFQVRSKFGGSVPAAAKPAAPKNDA
jgi:O-antigen/teichoic acid export membrane protein